MSRSVANVSGSCHWRPPSCSRGTPLRALGAPCQRHPLTPATGVVHPPEAPAVDVSSVVDYCPLVGPGGGCAAASRFGAVVLVIDVA